MTIQTFLTVQRNEKTMKYVVDEIDLRVIEVPNDYIKCSVCHKWMPKSSYCNEHGVQVRTNCEECYQLKPENMVEIQKKNRELVSANYRSGRVYKLNQECGALRNAITKEEFIDRFNEAMSKIPNGAKVCMVEYDTDNFGQSIEDYMEPDFDPILKFDGKVWLI